MSASLLDSALNIGYLIHAPWLLVLFAFQAWMFVHAVRQQEWVWAVFIFIGFGLSALLYYFMVYRAAPSATRGFELPGAVDRRRIKQLQAQIHHLDKAHHHLALADIYFQQGKLDKAEASYRAALERDDKDLDTRSHLGQCLLRLKRPAEAGPLLGGVVAENPRHEYGYTQMALAETYMALGEKDAALEIWKQVTENNSYPRAKVQLAQLYVERNEPQLAKAQLEEVVRDDLYAPTFQRKRDRLWVGKAKGLLRKLPA